MKSFYRGFTGSIVIALLPCLTVHGLDGLSIVAEVDVTITKAQSTVQTGADAFVPDPEGAFSITCIAYGTVGISDALVIPPGNAESIQLRDQRLPDVPAWSGGDPFDSLAEMDASFADGEYTAVVNYDLLGTPLGTLTLRASLPSQDFPPVPRPLNFEAVRCVDAARDFTLDLAAFAGGTELDTASLQIIDDPATGSKVLSQTHTPTNVGPWHLTVPAGTLRPGRVYTTIAVYDAYCARAITNSTILGGLAPFQGILRISRASFNRFTISTFACPRLEVLRDPEPRRLRVRFATTPGRTYRLEGSEDLRTWTAVGTTNAAGTTVEFRPTIEIAGAAHFLRVAQE